MLSSRAELEEDADFFLCCDYLELKAFFLSYALTRSATEGLKLRTQPVLDDLDGRLLRQAPSSGQPNMRLRTTPTTRATLWAASKKRWPPAAVVRPTSYKPPADFKPSDTSQLKSGKKWEHPKFGFGSVAHVDDSGPDRKARIQFEGFGEDIIT